MLCVFMRIATTFGVCFAGVKIRPCVLVCAPESVFMPPEFLLRCIMPIAGFRCASMNNITVFFVFDVPLEQLMWRISDS